MKKYTFFLFTLLIISCGKDPVVELPACDVDELSFPAQCAGPSNNGLTADQLAQAYIADNGLDTEKTASGMYYIITNPGGSEKPSINATVNVDYSGYYRNNCAFDGSNNVNFPLSGLIQGWQEGIPLVGRCGTIKLIIPPSLAYGNNPTNGIAAGEPLIFDINLLDF